ncbi:putative NADH:ubiquinone reductase (H(+)-translocating) [Helianthus annuus]|nr:putative NADH:ubiquinone reductase (H(+)-translocating) [Helianthus annuus]
MGGGMEANKNKFIEDWGTVRENLEHNFRWTRRNLAIVGIFGVAIPYLVYKGTVREFFVFKLFSPEATVISERENMKLFANA